MPFHVHVERRPNTFGLDDRVWVLDNGDGSFVEVAPSLGFNAYRWHVPQGELLYADPRYFQENKPTRSGFPILFPFPNRIRDGRFSREGKEYRLPTNDSTGKNAIHGFACQRPWRVVAEGDEVGAAWVTGEFVGSKDAPETRELWPADYKIEVTYRFEGSSLEVFAQISNPDTKNLPFGLGYHPYFDLGLFGGGAARVSIRAGKFWELTDNLPTGKQQLVAGGRDLREGKPYDELRLDDVFTDLEGTGHPGVLALTGMLAYQGRRLELHTSGLFREMVGFTPPHRKAVCLEPYTCVTDAINLQQQGIDAGLQVLKPARAARGWLRLVYRDQS